MREQKGFTIVELVVVITIMAILLTLSVIGLNSSQVNARDEERRNDANNIARGLEARYKQGNPKVTSTPGNYTVAGGYPSVNEFLHMTGVNMSTSTFVPAQVVGGYLTDALPGTSASNFAAPGSTSGFDIYCNGTCTGGTPENATYLSTKVTKDTYIYEPLTSTGAQCNSGKCAKFNLYYRKEAGGALQTIRSEHQ